MNKLTDEQLDHAINLLLQGKNFEEVLRLFPQQQTDLSELLEISQKIIAIPKQSIPRAYKQYKFKDYSRQKLSWKNLVPTYKLAAIPLVILGVIVTSNAMLTKASNSLPGDSLYSLKRASEQAKINFTFDETKLASLQLELAEKRLDETKQAIENNNQGQQIAALNALKKQVESTFNAVPVEKLSSTPQVLNNLIAINKKQDSLLSKVAQSEASSEVKNLAIDTKNNSKENLIKIIAAVNEQSFTPQEKIYSTGKPSLVTKTYVVLNKQTFLINENTIIINDKGEVLTSDVDLSGKITITAIEVNKELIAKRINTLPEEVKTTIKTQTPKTTTTNTKPANTTLQNTESPIVETEPKISTGFIIEPKF